MEGVYRAALERVSTGGVRFTGYLRQRDDSNVVAIVRDGQLVESVASGDEAELVFENTPFYGTTSSQTGDAGIITSVDARATVSEAETPIDGLVIHRAQITHGKLAVGDRTSLQIEVPRRDATGRNHSAAHLLGWALRSVMGAQYEFTSVLARPEDFRIEFRGAPLTGAEVASVEDLVHTCVMTNVPVWTELVSQLGQGRGGTRVVRIAESLEPCCGTHVRATGEIGLVAIAEQVSSGVSSGDGGTRITGVTGMRAVEHMRGRGAVSVPKRRPAMATATAKRNESPQEVVTSPPAAPAVAPRATPVEAPADPATTSAVRTSRIRPEPTGLPRQRVTMPASVQRPRVPPPRVRGWRALLGKLLRWR
jgi:alanyl-tRNA synthetase